jgi:hypothetical protein
MRAFGRYSAFDPQETLDVHCGNGFDGGFQPLSKYSLEALGCRLLSLGENMQRREFIRLLGGAAAGWPLAVRAQQPAMPVIGFLSGTPSAPFAHLVAAYRQGLREMGYVGGRNVAIEYRFAENQRDRLPALVADLVGRNVAVITRFGDRSMPL